MLEARGVDLVRGGCPVLAGVNLTLSPGEFVALCGPNGAGKSSLLAVLSGELRPDAGAVLNDGRPVAAFPAAALAATGLAGYATRPADRLSGGEQARAHLVRVLVQLWAGGRGRFLLLDEPTASLDLSHQHIVMRAARAEGQAGAGVVAVLHDLTLAANFADRVVMISQGRAAMAGPPDELMEPDLLGSIYGASVRVERVARAPHVLPDLLGASSRASCGASAAALMTSAGASAPRPRIFANQPCQTDAGNG